MGMDLTDVARLLKESLRSDPNVQTVGIRPNNVIAYDKNPERFRERLTKDSFVVYTLNKPTKKELKIKTFQGYQVEWIKSGRLRLL